MKRRTWLSLLVAICMVFGLTAAASAAVFTDSDSIGTPYRTAVEEMAARGVLNGFPDGEFRPSGTLTREQGAKIIAYMVLGDGVNDLTCSQAPFDDVAADRWSAPCIAWCVERQILLGYGDGRYGPDDTLTGDQFAKMLLCALDMAREGNYAGLGAGWYAAAREDAAAAGLYAGDPTMVSDRPIARQQASLMAWNAVNAAEAEPAAPVQPAEPVLPAEPVQPSLPILPTDPPLPAVPQQPIEPTLPSVPTQPSTPTQPTAPTQPTTPPQSGGHTDSNGDILLPEVP